MTPKDAIKKLEELIPTLENDFLPGYRDAAKLGIEALIRHSIRETLTFEGMMRPLAGETKE